MTQEAETTKEVKPIWKCQVKGCNFVQPPTLDGYNKLTGHQLHHAKAGLKKGERGIRLIDDKTGEELAKSLNEARDKGFLEITPVVGVPIEKPIEKPTKELTDEEREAVAEAEAMAEALAEAEAEAKAEAEAEAKARGEEGEITVPQVSPEGILRYTVTLPADAFALFNMAKACGYVDKEKIFDEFLWECITKRFERDWKVQVVIAPLEEEV
ncbi:hypothetical protein ES703_21968 [subsurface metagenome]